MQREFDVIVVGAGPAGEVAAGRLAQHGKKVAVVERWLVGGECSFYACMPSKALLRPGELMTEVGRVPGVSGAITGELDVQAVLDRRDEVIHNLSDDAQVPWLEHLEIELVRGAARLDGDGRVLVGDELLTAKDAIILAVGSGAVIPPIPGLADAGAWSSHEITVAKEVPPRLLVLGAGAVGVEMAQAWASLGSQVTVLSAGAALLEREEPFAGEQVQEALEGLGVQVRNGVKVESVSRLGDEITVTLEGGESLTGDRLLVATGRKPLTADLGLETIGLTPGETIEVDDNLQVKGAAGLYAIGDVNGRAPLTHAGKYQGRIAADNILGKRAVAISDNAGTPRVVFTDPQVASVGVTLKAAMSAGIHAVKVDVETEGTAGASFYGRGATGTTRFVVDASREVLIGATFVGPDITDFLQAATIAIVGEVPLSKLAHVIAPFPTRSEIWLQFIEGYEKEKSISLHAERP